MTSQYLKLGTRGIGNVDVFPNGGGGSGFTL